MLSMIQSMEFLDVMIVNKYKVGDCVIYSDNTYWKIYEVLRVSEHGYGYKCLASSYASTNMNGCFAKECLVAERGEIVSKDEVTAFILAKAL